MESTDRHPDDETLFRLIEHELDEAQAREVEAHLDGCASCGALVRAAIDGSPDHESPVEAMDAAQVQRMDAALAGAWRERVAGIAAAEAAQDARDASRGEATEQIAVQPLAASPAVTTSAPASVPRGAPWRRRAVPVLAFVVLAALAGVSIQIGRDDGAIPRGDHGSSSSSTTSTGSSAAPDGSTGAGTASKGTSAAPDVSASAGDAPAGQLATPAAAPEGDAAAAQGEAAGGRSATGAAPSGDGAPAADTAGGTAAPVPPVAGAPTDVLAEDQVCIATRDESRLVLPDGRIPRQVVAGPLGTYIVCG